MKVLAVLSMCLFSISAVPVEPNATILQAPRSRKEVRLIDAVVTSDYNSAVRMTLELNRDSKGDIISDAVERIIRDSKRNLLDYTYKLWNGEGKQIVKDYFPTVFRQIFSESSIKIIGVRDNLAIKLGVAQDSENDRIAYGDANDKTSDNISWKFVPIWENNQVFFKIIHNSRHQSLKLGTDADSDGDHIAYGDDVADTHRHQWYLRPTYLDNKIVFFIYNRKYNQGLKLGRAVDGDGDRRVYSNAGEVAGQPDIFGWVITA